MSKANLENATANILLTINGEIHLVATTQDKLDAITMLIKASADAVVPTGRHQGEFNQFLGYGG